MLQGDVRGKRNETTLVHTQDRIPSPRVLVLGLGKNDAFDGQVLRNYVAVAARHLRRVGAESVAISADPSMGLAADACARAIVEGFVLGHYRYLTHKKPPEDDREVRELVLVEPDASVSKRAIGRRARSYRRGGNGRARDLANEPPNS
jgi:leucyl aminopeptidase